MKKAWAIKIAQELCYSLPASPTETLMVQGFCLVVTEFYDKIISQKCIVKIHLQK